MRVSTAVKVAIRTYFACARGFEPEIYTRLMDINRNKDSIPYSVCGIDFSDINPDIYVWHPFEVFSVETLLVYIDTLIDDIIAETIGEK